MKKIISVLTGLALVAGAAMADGITFGSWGRGLWNVAANSGDDVVTDMHQSWGGAAPRTGIGVSGSTENVGFAVDMHANGDSGISLGDNALIWVKPIEQIKIVAGKKDQNELRGDAAFGLWNWDRIGAAGAMGLEGWTFPDVFDGNGVAVVAYPVDGLTVGAGIPLSLNGTGATLENTYAHGANYAAAYAIDGVGTIKAAYMTKATAKDSDLKDKDYGVIAAAFDLTMVDGLYASVGAQIPTAHVFTGVDLTKDNIADVPTVVNAYARYSLDALAVHLAVGTKLNTFDVKKAMKGDDAALDGQVGFAIGAGADYSLDNGIGFFGDVRYANGIYMANTSADKSDCLTFGLGVEKNFSNGKIGIAFEGATNGKNGYGRYTYEDDAFAWEIPVKVEYRF